MKIHVSAQNPYDVIIEAGCLQKTGENILPYCGGKYAAIVTDETVDALYGEMVEKSLRESGIRFVKKVIKPGEASKNAENYIALLEFLAENRLTRTDLLLALGGGVVGDLTGFAAATYLRGISFVQVPTTLLAMVDSSVGGKTAIDLRAGKNLAGAFYQPKTVLCDPCVLSTLSEDILADGCAEVIKYGVLGSESLFSHMQEKGLNFDREAVIEECVLMKSRIVNADEFDHGMRQLLNFGHTFGHAVEKLSDFGLSHGKAVAIGMVMMAKSAEKAGICEKEVASSIIKACEKAGLPTKTSYSPEAIYEALLSDKKRQGDSLTLVVPEKIGTCSLRPTAIEDILAFLQKGI